VTAAAGLEGAAILGQPAFELLTRHTVPCYNISVVRSTDVLYEFCVRWVIEIGSGSLYARTVPSK
jgi:hypothetical protein